MVAQAMIEVEVHTKWRFKEFASLQESHLPTPCARDVVSQNLAHSELLSAQSHHTQS